MSKVIIEMEMPKHCFGCGKYTKVPGTKRRCYFTRHVVDENVDNGTREAHCPLKEIDLGIKL